MIAVEHAQPTAAASPASRLATVSLLLLFAFTATAPLTSMTGSDLSGGGSAFRQLSYLVILVLAVIGTGGHLHVSRLLVLPRSLAILLAFCLFSLLWAINPEIGLRRLVLTGAIILTIFILVDNLSVERSLDQARRVLPWILAANFAAVLLSPQIGIHEAATFGDPGLAGDWRGIFPDKNAAGAVTALTIILFVFHARAWSMMVRTGVIVASAVFLYSTGSKTSIGVLAIALFAGWMFTFYSPKHYRVLATCACLLLGVALLVAYSNWDDLMAPFGREDALTGRVQIWPIIVAYISDHPFGAGFGSFWNVGPDSPIYFYAGEKGWIKKIASAHNGYLDLAAQVGLPGLFLAIVSVVLLPLREIMASEWLGRSRGSIALALLVFCIGHNVTETSLLDRDNVVEVFFMFALAVVAVARREAVPRQETPRLAPADLGGLSR